MEFRFLVLIYLICIFFLFVFFLVNIFRFISSNYIKFFIWFWSFKEMRLMVCLCVVIGFTSLCFDLRSKENFIQKPNTETHFNKDSKIPSSLRLKGK